MPHLTLEQEIARVLAEPSSAIPRSKWVTEATESGAALHDRDQLCEVATEAPDGPLVAIRSLMQWVIARHADDAPTVAAAAAVADYHLPNLVDALREDCVR